MGLLCFRWGLLPKRCPSTNGRHRLWLRINLFMTWWFLCWCFSLRFEIAILPVLRWEFCYVDLKSVRLLVHFLLVIVIVWLLGLLLRLWRGAIVFYKVFLAQNSSELCFRQRRPLLLPIGWLLHYLSSRLEYLNCLSSWRLNFFTKVLAGLQTVLLTGLNKSVRCSWLLETSLAGQHFHL